MHKNKKKIFFSGIGGSGLSAIASLMADKGNVVVGSDRSFDAHPNSPLKSTLQSKGITILPQDGKGLDNTIDLAVFSTAVEKEIPEVTKAGELGIPVKTRPEYLTEVINFYKTIAVSGTSGKSTTSGLLAFLMNRLGFDTSFIGGGRVKQFKNSSNPGNSFSGTSEYLVIEACESDGTIVNYQPRHSIVLNLSLDHNPVIETAEMFKKFIKNTEGIKIINADDENLKNITFGNVITFSIEKTSDYRAREIRYNALSTDFLIGETEFTLALPGKHNLYNALSCISMLSEMGISLNAISEVMPEFQGIDRRFDIHLNDGKNFVIDDYAHNPHKISALMETTKKMKDNICYIFQPHGFGPTKQMKKEYIETFVKQLRPTDHLFLLPIFYAGGSAARDISSNDLADEIRPGGHSVEVIEERSTVLERIKEWQTYVIFGARDDTLADFAKQIADKLRLP